MQYIDLHSHFLPGIDDGCKTCEESVAVLTESLRQGVRFMAATPHYYPQEPVQEFLTRRSEALQQLAAYVKENQVQIPKITIGAEVAYRMGISREPMLPKLCYGKSHYLLLELPFRRWNPGVLQDVEEIRRVRGLVPVIAHLERYAKFQDKNILQQLFELDVLVQMNGECVLGKKTGPRARRNIKAGMIDVLGSDAHNMAERSPNLGLACDELLEKGLDADVERMMRQSAEIFKEALLGRA